MKKIDKTAVSNKQAAGSNAAGHENSRETDYLLHSIVQGFSIPEFVIGKNHKTTLDAKHLHIQIPECKVNASYPIGKLTCVFELSTLFLIYISTQDVYILPKRALKDEESDFLRENFRTQLGTRFYTRLGRSS